MLVTHIFSFSVVLSKAFLGSLKVGITWYKGLALYHIIASFNDPRIRFWKTLLVKEKMLVTSIFSFSHSIFYSTKERNYHLSNIYRLQNAFNLVMSKILSFGKGLTCSVKSTDTQNFACLGGSVEHIGLTTWLL